MPLTKPQRRRLVPYMRTDERANTFGTLNFAVLSAVALRWPEHYWCFHLMISAMKAFTSTRQQTNKTAMTIS